MEIPLRKLFVCGPVSLGIRLPRVFAAMAIFSVLGPASALAQGIDSYDAWFRSVTSKLVVSSRAPALSVAVMAKDRIIYADAGGSIETPARRGPSPATMYRVGSLTKLFTASLAARLAARGIVDLDADVRRYVPEFPAKSGTVTLRELAGHLSGIRHYGPGEFINRTHFDSLAPTIRIFRDDTLLFEPGARYFYSSYGYNLLGLALERATHKPYLRLLHEEVIAPLGLRLTAPDQAGKELPERATPFDFDSAGRPVPAMADDLSDRWPSGGLLSSVTDLATFGSAFLRPGFLTDSMIKVMTTVQHLRSGTATTVGLGWRIGSDSAGRTIWHHAGSSYGGRSLLVVWPLENLVVAIASNAAIQLDLPVAFALAEVARAKLKYQ
jgi:CubicO group peptidase (beta-lactamase class C family)